MITFDPLASKIDEARCEVASLLDQLAAIKRRIDIAQARLEAFEIATAAYSSVNASGLKEASRGTGRPRKTRNRLPNAEWKSVFAALHHGYITSFGYDEIMLVATVNSVDVKRSSLGTKMMNYVHGGYVERKDAGQFSLTSKGLSYFKIGALASKEKEPSSVTAVGSDAAGSDGGTSSPASDYSNSPLFR